jgi:putative membrane protein insertion efficiency factor
MTAALDAAVTRPRRRTGAARVATGLIRAYQAARLGRVSPCRFTPTCSQYALEAVDRHGARRGLAITARRLSRCRPGGPFGFDPVPE